VTFTRTGPDGVFNLSLGPGAYTLHFKKTGYDTRKRRMDTSAGVTVAHVAFSAAPETMRVFQEPEDGESPLVDLMESAAESIRISIYQIVNEDYQMNTDILNALANASANGVSVQFVFNDFNNTDWPASGKKYLEYEERYAQKNGMTYQLSSSAFPYTHNKYMIIDDCLAVIMTGNLDYGSFPPGGYTKNFYVVDTFADHVDYLSDLFSFDVQNGVNNTGYTPPDIPDSLLVNPNDGFSVKKIADLIIDTSKTLDIYMMYFDDTCPHAIFEAINHAATNGVTIRVIASNDQEPSVVNEKLAPAVASGHFQMVIEPYDTSPETPFIHTKTFISDRKRVLLGSMNMSYTSLMENREVDLYTGEATVVSDIQAAFDADWTLFFNNPACTFIPPIP